MDFPRLSTYLAGLAANNEKAWFEANRAGYQALRDDFHAFVGEVIAGVAAWDESVRWVDPKDCIFRIYRDVRFSNDKTPYKTTFSAVISERGRHEGHGPSYYFQVDQHGDFVLLGNKRDEIRLPIIIQVSDGDMDRPMPRIDDAGDELGLGPVRGAVLQEKDFSRVVQAEHANDQVKFSGSPEIGRTDVRHPSDVLEQGERLE
jgi:hypothetical protein